MRFNLFILFLLITATAFAQDCTKESLRKKPGAWKAGPAGQIVNVSPADLAKEKLVIAAVHKMVTSHYSPIGCQAQTSNVYGKSLGAGKNWMADPYYYTIYVLRYLCDPSSTDKSKYYVDISTATKVNVAVNHIQWLSVLYASELPADDFRGYLKLKQRPVKKDGVYFMEEEVVGDSHLENKIKEYRWLITYNDTLPFSYVSRKEYLLIQKKKLEQSIKENPDEKEYTSQFLKTVNDYLKKTEAELSEPAICMWNDEERFTGFVKEGSGGSFIAIKPNLAYYHKNLPKSSPQFFTVVYKIAHGDPVFEENIANIKKAVDFTTLKNMLGK